MLTGSRIFCAKCAYPCVHARRSQVTDVGLIGFLVSTVTRLDTPERPGCCSFLQALTANLTAMPNPLLWWVLARRCSCLSGFVAIGQTICSLWVYPSENVSKGTVTLDLIYPESYELNLKLAFGSNDGLGQGWPRHRCRHMKYGEGRQ